MAWWRKEKDEPSQGEGSNPFEGEDLIAVERIPAEDPERTADSPVGEDALAQWLDDMSPRLYGFLDFGLPEAADGKPFRKDFTVESLQGVEDYLLHRIDSPADFADPDDREFATGIIRYLGETILRRVGGQWEYDNPDLGAGFPYLRFDGPEGELTGGTISPMGLIDQAITERSRTTFTTALTRLIDNFGPSGPLRKCSAITSFGTGTTTPELQAWLDTMDQDLGNWLRHHAPEPRDQWNFSLESLNALARDIHTRYPTLDDYDNDAGSPYLTGAQKYYGQTLIKHAGGEWTHYPFDDGDDPDENYWGGYPFLRRVTGEDSYTEALPYFDFRSIVRKDTPEILTDRINRYINN
ncbi:hypothetical protein LWF01_02390 [Saxibacter everestensis]|uniref:Uncharacterized protein n=1 Tax=Saxibacter everestensis TaxID=2909229 RepID=A0ABY8QUH5_9MICO|nr:hypothetical protein LWF01_02390 [Brevibacteriaceae bacterium ZFBP1038]